MNMQDMLANPLEPKIAGNGFKLKLLKMLSGKTLLFPTITSLFFVSLSLHNYSLFHLSIEIFAIVIAFIIFALGWLSHSFTNNTQLNYLICGYFGIGILDLLHAFTFPGSDILPISGINTTIYFWLSARFLEASIFVLAAFFGDSKTQKTTILFCVFIYLACSIAFSFSAHSSTLFFNEGGLTTTKIFTEYFIIGLCIITLSKLMRAKRTNLNGGRGFVILSLALTIFSEFLFTAYFSVSDFTNLMGHVLKLFSFWFIFNAVVINNLNSPFQEEKKSKLLYKKLYESVPTAIWTANLSELNDMFLIVKQQQLASSEHGEFKGAAHFGLNLPSISLGTGNLESKRHFGFLSNTNLIEAIVEGEVGNFIERLYSNWQADKVIRIPTRISDEENNVLHVVIGFSVPNDSEDNASVPVSIFDVTEQVTSIAVREKANRALGNASINVISALSSSLFIRDPYTSNHQSRVATLAVEIAKELGWDEFRLEGLKLGASIHDIGKIKVPMEILNHPGKISADEFSVIKAHPKVGAQILDEFDFPWPIKEMVEQHHERIDGSGYPNGLLGKEIVEEAKIISVADVVEAITAHRPYRPALGIEEGLREVKSGIGTKYDREIAETCIHLIENKKFTWENT